jgi:hypothetical protein
MAFFVALYSYDILCCFVFLCGMLVGLIPLSICLDFKFIWASNQHGLKLVTNLHMSRKSRGQHEDLCSLVFLWHSLKLCILMWTLVGLIPLSICLDFNSFEHPINMVWSLWQISIWVENQEDNMKTFVALYSYDIPWSFVFSWHSL